MSRRNLTITVNPGANLNNIFSQKNFTKIVLNEGNYYINDILKIDWDNVSIIGRGSSEQINIHQTNPERDSLSIKGSNITVKNISIHNPHSGKVCLVAASVNSCYISNCHFYGNQDYFTVFFAGPSNLTQGESTVTAYLNNRLDNNNRFERNVIYTNFSGDSVSWSLQRNGQFRRNLIRGGKLAVYMCRSCDITENSIYDSSSQGVFISLPCQNVTIKSNKIWHCNTSGITIKPQKEHITDIDTNSINHVEITDNLVYDNSFIGIELNEANAIYISGNDFSRNNTRAIYLQQSYKIHITNNNFSYFDTAIQIVSSKLLEIKYNAFLSIHPKTTNKALLLQTINGEKNQYNNIINNMFYGKYLTPINDEDPDDTNYIKNNKTQVYYSFREEQRIIKGP